jgi:bifunctional glutamyl/prolyl-tRNA synthetase
MAQLKKGDTIQILRKGYYICDVPYDAATKQPCRLFNIPDGGTKEKPTSLKATDTAAAAATAKGAGDKSKSSATTVASSPELDQLIEQIVIQGEKVRELKGDKSNSKVNETYITNKKEKNDFLLIRMTWMLQ